MIVKTLWGEEEIQSKICVKCKKDKPLSAYTTASGGNYKRTECLECSKILTKRREKFKEIYGNPPSDYCCPICHRNSLQVKGKGGNAGEWCVDHNHETGEFRGWLCHDCNRGLGGFKDNIEFLERAIKYSKKPYKLLDSKNKLF